MTDCKDTSSTELTYFTVSESRHSGWLAGKCTREEAQQLIANEIQDDVIYVCVTKDPLQWPESGQFDADSIAEESWPSTLEINQVNVKVEGKELIVSPVDKIDEKLKQDDTAVIQVLKGRELEAKDDARVIQLSLFIEKVMACENWPKIGKASEEETAEGKEMKESKFSIEQIEKFMKAWAQWGPVEYELQGKRWIGTKSEMFNRMFPYSLRAGSWRIYDDNNKHAIMLAVHQEFRAGALNFERVTAYDSGYGFMSQETFDSYINYVKENVEDNLSNIDDIVDYKSLTTDREDDKISFTSEAPGENKIYLYLSKDKDEQVIAFFLAEENLLVCMNEVEIEARENEI